MDSRNPCSTESDHVKGLESTNHCLVVPSAVSVVQNLVSRLKEYVNDHKLYDEALDSAASWLKLMSKRVQACSDSSGDWHTIQDRIEGIKVTSLSYVTVLGR